MSDDETTIDDSKNFDTFRDCLFSIVLEKLTPKVKKTKSKKARTVKGHNRSTSQDLTGSAGKDAAVDVPAPEELVDFSDYLANEIFPSLPEDLRTISYKRISEDTSLSDKWSLPLTLGALEELVELMPGSISDSLQSYGFIHPPESDVQSFLASVLTSFLPTATAQPPKWIDTRADACEICERDWINLTYHHLIPRETHAKVLKRGWHEEDQLNSVAWLCRTCHNFVHRMATNEELAREWFTVERIMDRDDAQKYAAWVSTVRWKKR